MLDCSSRETKNTIQPKRLKRDSLVSRNITIGGHRTSARLEPEMWSALQDVCRRERTTMHEIATMVADAKPSNASLTAALRVFIMAYFRVAATEDGHSRAGHGQGIMHLMRQPVIKPSMTPPTASPSSSRITTLYTSQRMSSGAK